ncbi:hypothetical protein Maes01_01902 [Microbulbifer aestuariivivens]|uniref:PBP domain-containing protein n=2 Tax=Microbulbifer aestuariivivens TaxID=1908308 RepID=A0ABP9WSD4_9GAMM
MVTSIVTVSAYFFSSMGGAEVGGGVAIDESLARSEISSIEAKKAVDTPRIQNSTIVSHSCFVPYTQVSGKITIINISRGSLPDIFPAYSIHLPAYQLKQKSFLKGQSLLVVAEPYKRYELTKLCIDLIADGFVKPKIGIWSPANNSGKVQIVVPPEEFLIEARNFGAVTIAENKLIADKLKGYGVEALYPESGQITQSFIDSALSQYPADEYLPVFVVADKRKGSFKFSGEVPVYAVQGGMAAIDAALSMGRINSLKANGKLQGVACVD